MNEFMDHTVIGTGNSKSLKKWPRRILIWLLMINQFPWWKQLQCDILWTLCRFLSIFPSIQSIAGVIQVTHAVKWPQCNVDKKPSYHLCTHWCNRSWLASYQVLMGQRSFKPHSQIHLPKHSHYFPAVCHFVVPCDISWKHNNKTKHSRQNAFESCFILWQQHIVFSTLIYRVKVFGRSPWHPLRGLP